MELRNNLADFRKKGGYNQADLGGLVGVSRQTISLIERGDYNPSVTVALTIAMVLGVDINEIFSLEESDEEKKETFLTSVLYMVGLGLVVGFGVGFIFNKLNIGGLIEVLSRFLSQNILVLTIGICSIFAVLGLHFYIKAKKEVEDGLREDGFIETKYIDYANAMRDAGLFSLLSLIIIIYNEMKKSSNPLKNTLIILVILFVFTAINSILSYLTYKLVRKIEPERKTEIFDFFFDSKFMAESDERDKLKYYKKGYLSYKRMLMCQFVMIIILFCSALYENISPIIALIVLIPCLVGVFTNGFAGEKS